MDGNPWKNHEMEDFENPEFTGEISRPCQKACMENIIILLMTRVV